MEKEICETCGHKESLHFGGGCVKDMNPNRTSGSSEGYKPCSCKKFKPKKIVERHNN